MQRCAPQSPRPRKPHRRQRATRLHSDARRTGAAPRAIDRALQTKMPFSASLFRRTRYVLGHAGQSVWLFLSRNDDGNASETGVKVAMARRGAIEAAKLLQDRGSNRITDASNPGGPELSEPSIFAIRDGDDAAGARRNMPS